MPKGICVSSLVLCAIGCALAQPGAAPAFDVASVKVNSTSEGRGRPNIKSAPGSLTMINVTMKAALGWAYHVFPYQVNGPGWLEGDRFDIVAKAAGPAPEDQLRLMLQKLLADRFKVALHHETKEMQAYIVLVGKNGIKFHESADEGDMEMKPDGQFKMNLKRATMAQLADLIGNNSPFPEPVVDQTGLKGRYDISFDLSSMLTMMSEKTGIDDAVQAIIQLIQEQLGLKVERHKAPIEILVVDHAERVPTEN